ncbi:MAG: hypothetical protein GF384_05940 [Elusimicrobia bacterium]|nr:hypothetical protein [Elusimicrobiota bacterium]MBD3412293.1 hypothetical protein [Elusimicrobiota bacterium]
MLCATRYIAPVSIRELDTKTVMELFSEQTADLGSSYDDYEIMQEAFDLLHVDNMYNFSMLGIYPGRVSVQGII